MIVMNIYNGIFCVYMHTNKINGKIYVGQTSQKPEKRWNHGNGYKDNLYFYRAIQKYGWNNFEHEVIASKLTKKEADCFEQLLIKELDLMNPTKGYNLQSGGSHGVCSEISRQNIKRAARKRSENEQYRIRQSESHKGQRAWNKGKKGCYSDETLDKMRAASTGKHPSEETRKKMSESRCGEKNGMFGKRHSNETRNKISEKNQSQNNPKARKVNQYTLDNVLIKTWDYMKQAGECLNIPPQNISRCCRTSKGTAGGFKWSYAD